MADIRLSGVNKVYPGGMMAVENVNLHIRDGEFMILLGPSGCGKSTTLRMIAGLETITSGDLYLGGRRINDVDPRDRDLAIVFQNYALYPHMTVRDNLSFGLRLRHAPRDRIAARVAEVANTLGIGALLDRKPGALSGGQRQRVALGRALVRDPVAFLFDEPLSNLDAKLRASMRTELIKLHRQLGRTIVHVTHDQVEAMTMGQRVCIMKDGRIVQVGEPIEVYRNPVDTFVASFLASPPMNLLAARLEDGAEPAAVHGALRLPLPAALAAGAAAYRGRPVILGLRPEDMYAEPAAGLVPADVKVIAVEALGPETVLVSEIAGGAEIASRLGRDFTARVGGTQRLYVDPRRLHLFDPESTNAIGREAKP
jgi:ABC-type sugar transport system ATPase subunit